MAEYVETKSYLPVQRQIPLSVPSAALFRLTAFGKLGSKVQYKTDAGAWTPLELSQQSPLLNGALTLISDFDCCVEVINYTAKFKDNETNFFTCAADELATLNTAGFPVAKGVLLRDPDTLLLYGQSDGVGSFAALGGSTGSATSPIGQPAGTFIKDPSTGLIIGQADGADGVVPIGDDIVITALGPFTANTNIRTIPTDVMSVTCNVAGTFTLRNGSHTVGPAIPGFIAVTMAPTDPPRSFGYPLNQVNGLGIDVSGGGSFNVSIEGI